MQKIIFLLFIIGCVGLFYFLDLSLFQDPQNIRKFVLSFGFWSPIVFVVLFTLVPLTLFPDSLLAIAGGLVFGFGFGSLYILIGAFCGATVSFYIARYFSSWLREKLGDGELLNLDAKVKKNGFMVILLLRLVPLVPFDIISYSAGLSKIHYRDFIFATCVGIIPGVLVYANIGAQALDIGSNDFYISLALLIALLLFSLIMQKRLKKKF
ncbi:MAG: TVP38/TMEM64 family protein [Sulfurospirillum sp.]|nr:TVP38/TMEM64 family protein [Sulfurospirillum sp.]